MAKRNRPTKRVSQVQKDYQRERRRILRRIADYKRQGLIVDLDVPDVPKRITQGSVRRLQKITLKKIRSKTKAPDLETGEVIPYEEYARQKRRNRRRKKALPPSEGEQSFASDVPPSPPEQQNVSRETFESDDIDFSQFEDAFEGENVSRETYEERKQEKKDKDHRFEYDDIPFMDDEIFQNFRSRYAFVNEWAQNIIFRWLTILLDRYEKSDVARMLQAAADAGALPEGRQLYTDEIYTALAQCMNYLHIPLGWQEEIVETLEINDENFAEGGVSIYENTPISVLRL